MASIKKQCLLVSCPDYLITHKHCINKDFGFIKRYHKQFYHGISSVSGIFFLKPLEQRMGKGDMIEGLCHQCHRFIPACNGKKKNNYMLWYRHAHKVSLFSSIIFSIAKY